MKATIYADWAKTGKYGAGGKVMVQFRPGQGVLTAIVDPESGDVMPALAPDPNSLNQLLKDCEENKREPTQAEVNRLPTVLVPPVPVLIGEIEIQGEELLVLVYVGADNRQYRATIRPEDVQSITTPVNARINLIGTR